MNLWILKPVENLPQNDNPWEPWYDKAFGFVVRANTEKEARRLANLGAGDENRGEFLGGKISNTTQPWQDAKYSTCVRLLAKGKSEVIIKDFAAA